MTITFLLFRWKTCQNWDFTKVSELSILKWISMKLDLHSFVLHKWDILTFCHVTISTQSKRLACRQCRFLRYLRNACLAKLGGFLTGLHIWNIFESIDNLITRRGKAKLVQSQQENCIITVTWEPSIELNCSFVNRSDNCKRSQKLTAYGCCKKFIS